ncbi:curli-like amyloid fiber formation chaperone CsgH [Parapusillimonas granuli]|uniref:Curli assembly protein CsgC n=1 Tax=Parapusillimonas granuli TaxID=380911 RepID=A0A853G9L6_9BURK|nr:curli-like amyloid fiber formation chaperone CsgH [Parapusillimonas granuli]MBB5214322.1 hypothetical protein [Parapusillimonas granuli]NYT51426.1 hypothetical protein [Parapusillimonas granuli]
MITADSDIQAWLEAASRAQPSLIVPYVRSGHQATLRYRVEASKEGRSGKSVLKQGGSVTIYPGQAVNLGTMSLTREAGDVCSVVLSLYEKEKIVGNYRFDCPQISRGD